MERILGVDLSLKNSGVGLVIKDEQQLQLVDYWNIERGKMTIEEMLLHFFNEFGKLLDEYKPTIIAAEAPFAGLNKKTYEKLCYGHGVMLLMAQQRDLKVVYYPVMTIKSKILGGIKVKKADGTKKTGMDMKMEVQHKVFEIFGKDCFKKPFTDDTTDAISVAVVHAMEIDNVKSKQKKSRK